MNIFREKPQLPSEENPMQDFLGEVTDIQESTDYKPVLTFIKEKKDHAKIQAALKILSHQLKQTGETKSKALETTQLLQKLISQYVENETSDDQYANLRIQYEIINISESVLSDENIKTIKKASTEPQNKNILKVLDFVQENEKSANLLEEAIANTKNGTTTPQDYLNSQLGFIKTPESFSEYKDLLNEQIRLSESNQGFQELLNAAELSAKRSIALKNLKEAMQDINSSVAEKARYALDELKKRLERYKPVNENDNLSKEELARYIELDPKMQEIFSNEVLKESKLTVPKHIMENSAEIAEYINLKSRYTRVIESQLQYNRVLAIINEWQEIPEKKDPQLQKKEN